MSETTGKILMLLLTAAWLLPLAGFVVEIYWLRLSHRLHKGAAYCAVGCIGLGFLCSLSALLFWGYQNNWSALTESDHHAHAVAGTAAHASGSDQQSAVKHEEDDDDDEDDGDDDENEGGHTEHAHADDADLDLVRGPFQKRTAIMAIRWYWDRKKPSWRSITILNRSRLQSGMGLTSFPASMRSAIGAPRVAWRTPSVGNNSAAISKC